MRSLFLRIFVWFWLAMVVVAAVLIVSSPFFTRSRPGLERWQRASERALAARVEDAAARVERGEPGLDHESRRRGHHPVAVFTLDAAGNPTAGPPPPASVVSFARRVGTIGEDVVERTGSLHLLGRGVAAPDGERYVVVAVVRRPPQLVDLLEPGALGWRLAVLTLLVGALCLVLARQLTAPVAVLQGVVRRLAEGDLGARVDAAVESRRDEIGALARDFNAMASRIQGLVSAQQRLVRDVSHELRSPLARMRVALELARQRTSAGGGDDALERIGREAERLERMVQQLLTLSRLEAGVLETGSESVDLSLLAGEVAEDAAFEASARGVRVSVGASGTCRVTGHPETLRSVVDNLLRNAISFSPDDSEVWVDVSTDGTEAVVRVADHGPGVPDEQLTALFEPFFRVEESRDRERGGVGLGLAIAARAVQLHRGSIEARGRDGGGLEVIVRLPGEMSEGGTGLGHELGSGQSGA